MQERNTDSAAAAATEMQVGAVMQPVAMIQSSQAKPFCFAVTAEALKEAEEEENQNSYDDEHWWDQYYEFAEKDTSDDDEDPEINPSASSTDRPPIHAFEVRVPDDSSDSDLNSCWSDIEDQEESFGAVFGIGDGSMQKFKPMVDSGSIVNTCNEQYDPTTTTEVSALKQNLETVKGNKLEHYGYKKDVCLADKHGEWIQAGFEITDTIRPILSVKKGSESGSMTMFAPDYAGQKASKIIQDKE